MHTAAAPLIAIPGRSIARQVLWLAGPVLVEQTMLYLVGFSDTILTGRYLTVEDLAAVTVSSYVLWFLGSLLIVASAGGTALVARQVGAGDRGGAKFITQQAILLALVVGCVLTMIGVALAPRIVAALGLVDRAAVAAVAYLRIILAIWPLVAAQTAGVACLRGAGDTRTGMIVMLAINVVNVLASWSLVRGWGWLPSLGLRGVALGTAIAEGLGGVMVLGALAWGRSGLKLEAVGLIPRWNPLIRLLRISLPAAGESGTNSACQLWFLSLISTLGPNATAAHGVAIRCEAIAFLSVTAFSVAASTLTGQYLGARRPDLARQAALTAWILALLTLGLIGLILYIQADLLFSLFIRREHQEVAALGVPVLRLVAFALPFLATITVLSGSLRGAGDTRSPWVIVLVGYLAVRIPLTIYLTRSVSLGGPGWGLYGAWVAMFTDLVVRGLLTATRFAQNKWMQTRV